MNEPLKAGDGRSASVVGRQRGVCAACPTMEGECLYCGTVWGEHGGKRIGIKQGEAVSVGSTTMDEQQLTAILSASGHPRPEVTAKFMMAGHVPRPRYVPRTAQDWLNEAEAVELHDVQAVLLSALRQRLSPITVSVLDFVIEKPPVYASMVSERFGFSEQQAGNVLRLLFNLGLVERKTVTLAGRGRKAYFYSPARAVDTTTYAKRTSPASEPSGSATRQGETG